MPSHLYLTFHLFPKRDSGVIISSPQKRITAAGTAQVFHLIPFHFESLARFAYALSLPNPLQSYTFFIYQNKKRMKIMHGYAFFIFILSICGASKTYICVVNERMYAW